MLKNQKFHYKNSNRITKKIALGNFIPKNIDFMDRL